MLYKITSWSDCLTKLATERSVRSAGGNLITTENEQKENGLAILWRATVPFCFLSCFFYILGFGHREGKHGDKWDTI